MKTAYTFKRHWAVDFIRWWYTYKDEKKKILININVFLKTMLIWFLNYD